MDGVHTRPVRRGRRHESGVRRPFNPAETLAPAMSDANATQRMEVRGESDGESKFVAEARNHELVMDDPEAMGGEDRSEERRVGKEC